MSRNGSKRVTFVEPNTETRTLGFAVKIEALETMAKAEVRALGAKEGVEPAIKRAKRLSAG